MIPLEVIQAGSHKIWPRLHKQPDAIMVWRSLHGEKPKLRLAVVPGADSRMMATRQMGRAMVRQLTKGTPNTDRHGTFRYV